MSDREITTAETLIVLEAMEIAADAYQAEANRTNLRGFGRSLHKKAGRIRVIASNIKNRALDDSEFASAYRTANQV